MRRLSWLLFLLPLPLLAWDYSLQLKVSYGYPISGVFRQIYGEGAIFGFEFNMKQRDSPAEYFVQLEDWHAKGRAIVPPGTGPGSRTSIKILPFSFGARYWWVHNHFAFYTGLGPVLDSVRIHNESNLVERHIFSNSLGAMVDTGTTFFLTKDFLLNIFGKYTFQRINFRGSDPTIRYFRVDMSRFQMGLSIGLLW